MQNGKCNKAKWKMDTQVERKMLPMYSIETRPTLTMNSDLKQSNILGFISGLQYQKNKMQQKFS